MAIRQLPTDENSPVDLDLGFTIDSQDNLFFDMFTNNGDMKTTSSMDGWVINSLFINRRAPDDMEIQGDELDKLQGWWGDIYPQIEGDQWGSLLWTLAREKITEETLNRFEEFSRSALVWMIDDRIASEINVQVSRLVGRRGWILLEIDIIRPTGNRERFRFNYAWEAQKLEIAA